jgi:acetyl coenzyme A synthetase (ADP forming)-like protein
MAASKASHRRSRPHGNRPLDVFFSPQTVAVIGATETANTVGRTVMWNLVTSPFGGTVYPVNPKRSSVLGVKAYKSVVDVPEAIDLAVIVTPPPTVPAIVRQCGEAGVLGAVVISSGFQEIGPEGAELERQLLCEAHAAGIRVLGPNCLGLMSPRSGLNATCASTIARPGSVGFLSQSGALSAAVLDWSLKEMVGFSAFVSIGSMVDVGWGDLIYHLGNDPKTRSIVIYMESIGNARAFVSAAREVALNKPIIVIKPGRSLGGSDQVIDAAFRRCGVLRVHNIADLFYMAEVLSRQPRPRGPRLTIVTNAGGPGVLAADALVMGGGELAEMTPATLDAYNAVLPATWSHTNPIDILGDATPERYAKAAQIAANDANSDGMLVILTPQAMTDPTQIAEQLKPLAKQEGKPVLASWMGGVDVAAGEAILNRANIPTFPYADTAARAFNYMWQYSYNLKGLYETPSIAEESGESSPDRELVVRLVQKARGEGRTVLSEHESKQVLGAYGIPIAKEGVVRSHDAYELIVGSSLDPQFGPVLSFGLGGQLLEVFQDRALALPPLNTTLARRMMEQTKIYKALKGVRGRRPVDLAALEVLLVRFSSLVAEQRWIREIDINPLLASPDGLIAVGARVVVHGAGVTADQLPQAAVRPYPARYVSPWTMKDGGQVIMRPIRPEDEPLMVRFHETLSERSVYLRYFHLMNLEQRTTHERLTRICFIDYDREMALLAVRRNAETGESEILGVGRLMKIHGTEEAEIAVLISDHWHGKGLGKELLARLVKVAADDKLTRVVADILPDNRGVMRILDKLGFSLKHSLDDDVVRAELQLRTANE